MILQKSHAEFIDISLPVADENRYTLYKADFFR